jgi:hypothetical protein
MRGKRDQPTSSAPAETGDGLSFTRAEAIALLSMCMLAPTPQDPAAEQGLLKLARACRTFLATDDPSLEIEVLRQPTQQAD